MHKSVKRMLAALLTVAMGAQLAGCYTVDQTRFSGFVAQTVTAGMPTEQALVRMGAEDFQCDTRSPGLVIVCTRKQQHVPGNCIERVDISHSKNSKTVTAVDVPAIRCARYGDKF